VFEPVAFYGSLPSARDFANGAIEHRAWFGADQLTSCRVYVSFGTVVWRYYAADALRTLSTLSEAFSEIDDVRAVLSLGGTALAREQVAALSRPNVSVESYVDQWEILQQADVFLTHNGLNSTHEAIFLRVPMISYPFFWDQPALAAKCRKLGLAVPLTDFPRGKITKADVHGALAGLAAEAASMKAALARAREWELAVIDNRPAVDKRIVDLI